MALDGRSSNNIGQSSRSSNDNDGIEEAIGRSNSFADLPSFPHISAQFKDKKGQEEFLFIIDKILLKFF